MNKKLLRSEMVLHDDTNGTLAEALKISPQSLSAKMNETNGAEFTQGEMGAIRERYTLSDEKFIAIFFADTVS
jgi:DNA-binding transcriptional regulator YiaG